MDQNRISGLPILWEAKEGFVSDGFSAAWQYDVLKKIEVANVCKWNIHICSPPTQDLPLPSHCLTCQDLPSHILLGVWNECIHECNSSTIASQTAWPTYISILKQNLCSKSFSYLLFGILTWIEGTTRCYRLVDAVFWQYIRSTNTQNTTYFFPIYLCSIQNTVLFRVKRKNMQAVFDFTKCACYMIDVNTFSIEIGRSWGWRRCIVCTLNMFALNIHIRKCIIIIYTCIYVYIYTYIIK